MATRTRGRWRTASTARGPAPGTVADAHRRSSELQPPRYPVAIRVICRAEVLVEHALFERDADGGHPGEQRPAGNGDWRAAEQDRPSRPHGHAAHVHGVARERVGTTGDEVLRDGADLDAVGWAFGEVTDGRPRDECRTGSQRHQSNEVARTGAAAAPAVATPPSGESERHNDVPEEVRRRCQERVRHELRAG